MITNSKGDTYFKPTSLQSKTPVRKKPKKISQNVEVKDEEARGRRLKTYISNKKKSKHQLMKQLREKQRKESIGDGRSDHNNQIEMNIDNGLKTDKKKKNLKQKANDRYLGDQSQSNWDDDAIAGGVFNNDIPIQDFKLNVEKHLATTSFQRDRTDDILPKKSDVKVENNKNINDNIPKKIEILSQIQITDQIKSTLEEGHENQELIWSKIKKNEITGIKKEELFCKETISKKKTKNIWEETITNNKEKNVVEESHVDTSCTQQKDTNKKRVRTIPEANRDHRRSGITNIKIEEEELTIPDENHHKTDTVLDKPILLGDSSNSRKKIKFKPLIFEEHLPPTEQENEDLLEFLPAVKHSRKSRRSKNKNKAKSGNKKTDEVGSTKLKDILSIPTSDERKETIKEAERNGIAHLQKIESVGKRIETERQKCLSEEIVQSEIGSNIYDKTSNDEEKKRLQLETIEERKKGADGQEKNKMHVFPKPDKNEITLGLTDIGDIEKKELTIFDDNSYETNAVLNTLCPVGNVNKSGAGNMNFVPSISNEDFEPDNEDNTNLTVFSPKSENIKKSKSKKKRKKEILTSGIEILDSASNPVVSTDSGVNQTISPTTVLSQFGLSKSQKRRLRRKACKNNNNEQIIKSQDLGKISYRAEREINRMMEVGRTMRIRRRPVDDLANMLFAPPWVLDDIVRFQNEIMHNLHEQGENVAQQLRFYNQSF